MADSTYRCTWFFQDTTYNVGWTEQFWTIAADNAAAKALVDNYVAVRMPLAQDTTFFSTLRVCNVDRPRDSLYYPPAASTPGTIAHATYAIAGVWDTLLIRWNDTAGNLLSHMFLRLPPAGIFTGRLYSGVLATSPTWAVRLANYIAEVVSGPYRKKTGGAGGPFYFTIENGAAGYRTERRLGRPSDPLRGRRAVA